MLKMIFTYPYGFAKVVCQCDKTVYRTKKDEGNMSFETQVVHSLWLALCCGAWTCRLVLLCFVWKVGAFASCLHLLFTPVDLFLVGGSCHCIFQNFGVCEIRLSEYVSKTQ